MNIECKGCLYTLSSFVCLTEDLSEILQFLWRHGCLRKSYYCEKCGRKCAIGDKDLFFRCNRNIVETTELPQLDFSSSQTEIPSNANSVNSSVDFVVSMDQQLEYPNDISYVNQRNALLHPAIRPAVTLPGDPQPPHNPSLVYCQTMDRHFMLEQPAVVSAQQQNGSEATDKVLSMLNRNPVTIQSVEMDDIESLPDSDLADLDAQTKKFKRNRNGRLNTGSGLLKKRCNFKVSMKKGTFFEKSKLPIDTVCKFVVFWCCMKHPTQEFLRNELSLAARTVVDWSTTCREICVSWAKANSEKIGGDGVIVQVDEVRIVGIKPNETRNRFSYWGVEKDKEKGKLFIVAVPACDAWSLLNIVNDWILPGTIIVSNCWKSYDCLKNNDFIQQTVVHNKTFVHPASNTGINYEEQCDEDGNKNNKKGEDMQMPRFGTRRSHHLGDLAEFMFKRRYSNHLERMHAFFKQVAAAHPLT